MGSLVNSGWDAPADMQGSKDFRWYHVPAGIGLRLVILSRSPVCYKGHYHGGRMRPCTGVGCRYCKDGVGTQLRWVLGVVEEETHQVGVIELSDTVATEIRRHSEAKGALRNLRVYLQREGQTNKSRIAVQCPGVQFDSWMFSLQEPDLFEVLICTWQRAGEELPEELVRLAEERQIAVASG